MEDSINSNGNVYDILRKSSHALRPKTEAKSCLDASYNSFNTLSKSTGGRLIMYRATLTLLSRVKSVIFCHYLRTVKMEVVIGKRNSGLKNVRNLPNHVCKKPYEHTSCRKGFL